MRYDRNVTATLSYQLDTFLLYCIWVRLRSFLYKCTSVFMIAEIQAGWSAS